MVTRTVRKVVVGLALLAWLVGVPGLLHAACPSCAEATLARDAHCHDAPLERLQAAGCEGLACNASATCCAPREAEDRGLEIRLGTAPFVPLAAAATVPVAALERPDARSLRAADEPPRPARTDLHILYSALLI